MPAATSTVLQWAVGTSAPAAAPGRCPWRRGSLHPTCRPAATAESAESSISVNRQNSTAEATEAVPPPPSSTIGAPNRQESGQRRICIHCMNVGDALLLAPSRRYCVLVMTEILSATSEPNAAGEVLTAVELAIVSRRWSNVISF